MSTNKLTKRLTGVKSLYILLHQAGACKRMLGLGSGPVGAGGAVGEGGRGRDGTSVPVASGTKTTVTKKPNRPAQHTAQNLALLPM